MPMGDRVAISMGADPARCWSMQLPRMHAQRQLDVFGAEDPSVGIMAFAVARLDPAVPTQRLHRRVSRAAAEAIPLKGSASLVCPGGVFVVVGAGLQAAVF
jgi:hypothetical protein